MRAVGLHTALLVAALAVPAAAQAADAVVVGGLRNPVDKSYRKMLKGMDVFEAMHGMAPGASLRYKLLPRKRDTDMRDIAVHVVGDSFDAQVPVAADQTFTLQRDRKALDEDASVRPNRKADSMTWRAEIRTPGVPPDTRRLGDLRLECQVGMEAGLVSHYPSLVSRLADFIHKIVGFCDQHDAPYLFFAERPLFAVTMSAGARKQTVSAGRLYAGILHGRVPAEVLSHCDCAALLDRAYFVPLGERAWADDTRVELEYMDGPPAPLQAPAKDASDYSVLVGSTKAELLAAFSEARAVRFDSGFEVWAWQFGRQERRLDQTELVVLIDPSGIVTKARLRAAP